MMKLGMMLLFVSDLEESKRFYCDILGFRLEAEAENRLEFKHPGCRFVAFKCERKAEVENYSQVPRSVFAFEVASVDQSFNDLRSRGISFLHSEPAENAFCRYAAFRDPSGNVHEIYEPKI